MKRITFYSIYILVLISLLVLFYFGRPIWEPIYLKVSGRQTVADVLDKIGKPNRMVLRKIVEGKGVKYPLPNLHILAFKHEKKIELWTRIDNKPLFLSEMPILALSGKLGPKLREGDLQVPEGFYRIIGLNPNSSFYLSLKLNYPSKFDQEVAVRDKRTNLGNNIFIHGQKSSIGCLAIGNSSIEMLFVLIADIGKSNVDVYISPIDFRNPPSNFNAETNVEWVRNLYSKLKNEINRFK